jgi:hypothetical protein
MGLFDYLLGSGVGGNAMMGISPEVMAARGNAFNAANPMTGTGFSAGTVLDPTTGAPTGQNLWGQSLAGDVGNLFGSQQGVNTLGALGQGYNLWNQANLSNKGMDLMKHQQSMADQAYQDSLADKEQTQKLNF